MSKTKCRKKTGIGFVKFLLCTISICLLLLGALSFEKWFVFWNVFSYVLIFVGLPLLLLICFRKHENMRGSILICILVSLPFLILIYITGSYSIDKNYEDYLSGDSKFVNSAKLVMPDQDQLQDTKIVYYEHIASLDRRTEIYRLGIRYEEESYLAEKERLQTQYQEKAIYDMEDFYFDADRYYCYRMRAHDSAIAYSYCDETRTVSYIFFTYPQLMSCAPDDALTHLYERTNSPVFSGHTITPVYE